MGMGGVTVRRGTINLGSRNSRDNSVLTQRCVVCKHVRNGKLSKKVSSFGKTTCLSQELCDQGEVRGKYGGGC